MEDKKSVYSVLIILLVLCILAITFCVYLIYDKDMSLRRYTKIQDGKITYESKISKLKENDHFLFEVYSDRLNCPTVNLKVYDDGSYRYYKINNRYEEGKYTYNISKILNNLDQYDVPINNIGPFILKDNSGNTYVLYDNNIELKEFLKSININLDECMSFEFDH